MRVIKYGNTGTIQSLFFDGKGYCRVNINDTFIWYEPTKTGFDCVDDETANALELGYKLVYVSGELEHVPCTGS